MKQSTKHLCMSMVSVCLLSACMSTNDSRYSQRQDSAPSFHYGELEFVEPTPVFEDYNVWTSRPYEINGRYYTPMQTGKGFEQRGKASWYGQKFHGHTTANGEVFDMFSLTAAHTTLPLPSFVQVTNLENNESIVVRVNDRGPFHDDRIIDLSYAAAKRLGFHDDGTTNVHIEVIHVDESGLVTIGNRASQETMIAGLPQPQNNYAKPEVKAAAPLLRTTSDLMDVSTTSVRLDEAESSESVTQEANAGVFVQVLATSNAQRVKDLAKGLSDMLQVPTQTPLLENLYRLQIGPLENEQMANKVIEDLKEYGFDNAFTTGLESE